jgi:hypothetical protein
MMMTKTAQTLAVIACFNLHGCITKPKPASLDGMRVVNSSKFNYNILDINNDRKYDMYAVKEGEGYSVKVISREYKDKHGNSLPEGFQEDENVSYLTQKSIDGLVRYNSMIYSVLEDFFKGE